MRLSRCWIGLLLVFCGSTLAWSQPLGKPTKQGVVVSVSRPASEAGAATLRAGGNAVDAAIATAFALAVTWPEAGNIGGGGFMLVHPGKDRPPVVIDYREQAPAAATREMFAARKPSQYQLVGVPGTVRGLELAHQKLGKLPWHELLAPAIKLADEGCAVNAALAASLNSALKKAGEFPELRSVFAPPQRRQEWRAGDVLKQPELASTLQQIAKQGADGFYQGEVAEKFVAEMQRGGGIITLKDLAGYQAKLREPLHGTYLGYDIYAPPPPSSGGVCLIEMLNMLEGMKLRQYERWSPQTIHLMSEVMQRAYCDRACYLGDPEVADWPRKLITKDYAQKLAAEIKLDRVTKSEALAPEIEISSESEQTTHFSVIDKEGMAVSNTYTLEESFGSHIVVRGAGFLLNNQMGDFNPRPGVTTRSGIIGTAANEVRPGKRMLSSMCPTIVMRDGQPVLITGSPGGRTIINTVLHVVVSTLEYEMQPEAAVNGLRTHHQWFPDRIQLEGARMTEHPPLSAALEKMGHKVQVRSGTQGDAHTISIDTNSNERIGIADSRRDGWTANE